MIALLRSFATGPDASRIDNQSEIDRLYRSNRVRVMLAITLGYALIWSSLVPVLPFVALSAVFDPDAARWLQWQTLADVPLLSWAAVAYLGGLAAECEAKRPPRIEGACPRNTPGCKYADCSSLEGRSCYGPCAPEHMDMGL